MLTHNLAPEFGVLSFGLDALESKERMGIQREIRTIVEDLYIASQLEKYEQEAKSDFN